jgi:hypothetical protein
MEAPMIWPQREPPTEQRYERIGSWEISLAVPEPVRTMFRLQTNRLLSGSYASMEDLMKKDEEQAWCTDECLAECILCGPRGRTFISPDPLMSQAVYFQPQGWRRRITLALTGNRLGETQKAIAELRQEMDRLLEEGGLESRRHRMPRGRNFEGEYFICSVPRLFEDPEHKLFGIPLLDEEAVKLHICIGDRFGKHYVHPTAKMLEFWSYWKHVKGE